MRAQTKGILSVGEKVIARPTLYIDTCLPAPTPAGTEVPLWVVVLLILLLVVGGLYWMSERESIPPAPMPPVPAPIVTPVPAPAPAPTVPPAPRNFFEWDRQP